MAKTGWQRRFDEPIAVLDGRRLLTLRDAATYGTELPKKESALPEWQAAIEALILVADPGGPTMFVRNGKTRIRRFSSAILSEGKRAFSAGTLSWRTAAASARRRRSHRSATGLSSGPRCAGN
jgi:hypothetical protein